MDSKLRKAIIPAIIAGVATMAAAFVGGRATAPSNEVSSNINNSPAYITTFNNTGEVEKKEVTSQELPNEYAKLFAEYEDLLNSRNQLSAEYNNLVNENSELISKNVTLTNENSELINKYTALTNENNVLKGQLNASPAPTDPNNDEYKDFISTVPAYEKSWYFDNESRSMSGKKYSKIIFWNADYNAYSLYNLEGKYSEITGMLGHVDDTSMYNATFQIYFDGSLHKELELSCEDLAATFTINVEGVQQLKLCLLQTSGSPRFGLGDPKIK